MTKKHHAILYGLLTLSLTLAVAWALRAERESRRYAQALEDAYQGALLSALAQMEQLQGAIGKALVSADEGQSAQLIARISSGASAVQGGLSALPLSQPAMGEAVKLCNQLSDYAAALLGQADASLDESDAALLRSLSGTCGELLSALRRAGGQMRAGRLSFGADSVYLDGADGASRPLEGAAASVDYPTLIYDGPFSDAVSEDAPRGLGSGEVSREEAVRLAAEFTGAPPEAAVCTQESGGTIPAYVIQADAPAGVLQLAVTRQGGKVLWMFPERGGYEARCGLEECKRAAQAFFAAHGYGEMRLTFWQIYGGLATLSYAAVQDGVLLYPDLVKLQLRLDTLDVVGIEARRYLSSHTARANLTPALGREEAQGGVSGRIRVTGAQLCLIPLNRREILCWEFTGEYLGQTYYVYIDAATGHQRDIQRLVVNGSGPEAE